MCIASLYSSSGDGGEMEVHILLPIDTGLQLLGSWQVVSLESSVVINRCTYEEASSAILKYTKVSAIKP